MIKAISGTVILICLLLTASASAQSPIISSITPQEGTTEGGTRVLIVGQNLTRCLAGCETPRVQFGDVDALNVQANSVSRIEVVTPPGHAGSVRVRLTRQDGLSAVAPSPFTYVEIRNPVSERILLPIIVDRSTGAFGSEWESELAVHSEAGGLRALSVVYRGCQFTCPSEPVTVDRGSTRTFRHGIQGTDASQPGALLYTMRDEADLFFFSLHIMDRSRSTTSAGTEIPVIRERELYAGKVVLLNVPFRNGFRNLLRIYDPFPLGGDTPVVSVRIISDDNQILLERSIGLKASVFNDLPLLPGYPGYAQVSDFGDIQSRMGSGQIARIEIEPLTPGLRFWAFVAVTNNETQHVTTITPQ